MTVNISLLFLSVLFSFLSRPNFIILTGLSFFSWFSYLPLLLLIKRIKLNKAPLWGFTFGFFQYLAICSWLITYNVWAGIAVFVLFGLYWSLAALLLSYFSKYRLSFFINVLIIFVCEYLSTKGYLGFSYGVSGYCHWQSELFIKSSKFFGVWGITLAVISVNCFIADFKVKAIKNLFTLLFCFFTVAVVFLSGLLVKTSEGNEKVSFLLVQNNSDPWQDGIEQYVKEVEQLKTLTEAALLKHHSADFVVWPETAVVVDVINHYKLNKNRERYELAKSLFDWIKKNNLKIITGNNFKNYNSAILFLPSENDIPDYQVYSKNHLVPFSEHIPSFKVFKPLYDYMEQQGNAFWSPGNEINLLRYGNTVIGAPVCFEDTFSDIPAKMKKKGANVFVNLSNDSWSDSLSCQYMHLAMACFRSAENGIPSLRCTTSGQTCLIDSNGKVVSMLKPFTADTLYCEVNLNKVN